MPPKAVKTVRDPIFWEYAKLVVDGQIDPRYPGQPIRAFLARAVWFSMVAEHFLDQDGDDTGRGASSGD